MFKAKEEEEEKRLNVMNCSKHQPRRGMLMKNLTGQSQ